jgi:hypothetical protein
MTSAEIDNLLDIARGLRLPLLAYDAAVGHWDRLGRRIALASSSNAKRGVAAVVGVFGDPPPLDSGCGNRRERPDAPSLEALHHFARFARHPRSFARQVVVD